MKTLVLCLVLFSTSLFANYAYTGQNSGKIDMHGGKGDKLSGSSSFSNSPFSLRDSEPNKKTQEEKLDYKSQKKSQSKKSN